MYDIHSHVLFDLDDGAKGAAEAVELCRMAEADGVLGIVATPHIREPMWKNDRSRIEGRLADLRGEVAAQGLRIEVILGAEVYFDATMVDALRLGAYPTYADGRRYYLFELPNYFLARQVQDVVFELRTAGLTPVLAHPERNPHLMRNFDALEELVRMGTLLQVTAMSVTGKFGRSARAAAERILDADLAHFVASDAHHPKLRPPRMSDARRAVSERYGEARAQALFVENPRRVLAGEEIEPRSAEPRRERGPLRRLIARWI